MNSLNEILKPFVSNNPAKLLEETSSLYEVLKELKPQIPIQDNGEALVPIPETFLFFNPHPYQSLGAPYGKFSPWFLRQNVVEKLVQAETILVKEHSNYRLKIFDGYRPQSVQLFMRQYEHTRLATGEGLQIEQLSAEDDQRLWDLVNSIWAKPGDSTNPSPHSTGSAIDLTIADLSGQPIFMGSEIDEISERSLPNHFRNMTDKEGTLAHNNRELLNYCMQEAGFERLSHEWWHFSYGDQVWAVYQSLKRNKLIGAMYGEVV